MGSFDYFYTEDPVGESVRPGPETNTLTVVRTEISYFEVNAGLAWRLRLPDHPSLSPYAGAGVNVARSSFTITEERLIVNAFGEVVSGGTRTRDDLSVPSETEVGLNLFGGMAFGTGSVRPFGELRVELGGGGQVVVYLREDRAGVKAANGGRIY